MREQKGSFFQIEFGRISTGLRDVPLDPLEFGSWFLFFPGLRLEIQ
jgi:hypothetical protein